MDSRTGALTEGYEPSMLTWKPPVYADDYVSSSPAQYQQPSVSPYPYLVQYRPQTGDQTLRRSFPRWVVVLIVVVVLVGGVAALGLWASGKVREAREKLDSVPSKEEWFVYTDQYFTAKFPRQPKCNKRTTPNGMTADEVMHVNATGRWEVAHFAIPYGASFDLDEGMRGVADAADGRLTRAEDASHQGCSGRYGEIDNGRLKIKIIHARSRVYVIVSGDYRKGYTDDFEFFADNFRLTDLALGILPLTITEYGKDMLYEGLRLHPTARVFRCEGGRSPYEFSVDSDLPSGLGYETGAGGHVYLTGKAEAGLFVVHIRAKDADGRTASYEAKVMVNQLPDILVESWFRLELSDKVAKVRRLRDGASYAIKPGFASNAGVRLDSNLTRLGESARYPLAITRVECLGAPVWMSVTHEENIVRLGGTPEHSGEYNLHLSIDFVFSGSDTQFTKTADFTLVVSPSAGD